MRDIFQKMQDAVYFDSFNTIFSLIEEHDLIVDLGGGDGTFTKELYKKAEKVLLVDIFKKDLLKASKKGMKTICHDINNKLPFKDSSIDAFFLHHVIEHITDVDLLISEMWRCLKQNGKVYIATPNLAALHNRILLFFGKLPNCCTVSNVFSVGGIKKGFSPQHFRIFTFESLKLIFELYGFKAIEIKGSGFYPNIFISRLTPKIIPKLSVNIIAKFEKNKKLSIKQIQKILNVSKKDIMFSFKYLKDEYPSSKNISIILDRNERKNKSK